MATGLGITVIVVSSPWLEFHRIWLMLPFGVAAVILVSALRIVRRDLVKEREVAALAFAVLGAVLLTKQLLHPRIVHYGFALTVPAVAVCVVCLLTWTSKRIGHGAEVFRAAAIGLIGGVTILHLGL